MESTSSPRSSRPQQPVLVLPRLPADWELAGPSSSPPSPPRLAASAADSEEGGTSRPASHESYDPALEWPGSEEGSILAPFTEVSSETPAINSHFCRLVVLRSKILPPNHKVALIDAHAEVSIGRDATPGTPRLRLKEMAVSKYHANVFWDAEHDRWAIVDMGSVHGTYVWARRSGADVAVMATPSSPRSGERLSPPRVASFPKGLSHLDEITIAGTTLSVHIHLDNGSRPCEACVFVDDNDIPLLGSDKASKRSKQSSKSDSRISGDGFHESQMDPKKALAKLKKTLLSAHAHPQTSGDPNASVGGGTAYIDRAARRRAVHPVSRSPPRPPPSAASPPSSHYHRPRNSSPTPAAPHPQSQPKPPSEHTPISSTNVGHRLLLRQGWTPGSGLGPTSASTGTALVEPLRLVPTVGRSGLGLGAQARGANEGNGDWRAEGKKRRWDDLKY
ncbi:hypothetical protein BOTBODRAFT_160436 [Botryobasidium botryosum FD-172 SS1]|uniref:G-patch domain-containing protein n=1 Tax=Botryobasidium botryosum (strain FD-172 SS1) TaxID=930990 RepID=A0A067MCL3_BOTB1|nr:hypothetical protein BOTBODRAFT_160436 [Botryobasidium botryosum FD-172 SS1]